MDPNQQPPADNNLPQSQNDTSEGQTQNNWQYTSGQLTADQPTQPQQKNRQTSPEEALAEWSAQEFIEHDKNGKWYVTLAVGSVVISLLLYVITREFMSVIVTLLLAVAMAIYGSAKPKTVNYVINPNGISVDGKMYNFSEFKSFSIIEWSPSSVPYIQLIPQKRFMIPLSIFVDPAHSKDIAEMIGTFVPYDQRQPDFVDKLSNRFRF